MKSEDKATSIVAAAVIVAMIVVAIFMSTL